MTSWHWIDRQRVEIAKFYLISTQLLGDRSIYSLSYLDWHG
ncbi:hypothetical protein D934_10335 [Xylella fastidiosa subsp. sandyi Ann-1]|uniref:Uncharacterized protein n=1 Tax=Xylella fastidiosa subsp. sandyi Ann-1 TaxID=155920 RepID=A0A060H7H0_XYLFS|nr:hypothetical protein D934_10335 [Xylella fastidiosa subsp. sandyi Ann-1]